MKKWTIALFLAQVYFAEGVFNHSDIFTSAYAKVAKWGSALTQASNPNPNGEGRSSGQQFYTQSSTVDVSRGQNLKKLNDMPRPVYMHRNSKVDVISSDPLPGKGEVLQHAQDRFQLPPYFSVVDSAKSSNKHASHAAYPTNNFPTYVTPNPPASPSASAPAPAPAPKSKSKPPPTFDTSFPSIAPVKSSPPVFDTSFSSFSSPGNDNSDSNNVNNDDNGPPDSKPVISFTPPPMVASSKIPQNKPLMRPAPKPPAVPSYDSPYSSYNPPMEKPPMEHSRPIADVYDSPYSSYNPPRKAPKAEGPSPAYPPLGGQNYFPSSYLPPKMPAKQMDMMMMKKPMQKPKPMEQEDEPMMENEGEGGDDNNDDDHHHHHHPPPHHHHHNHEQIFDQLPEGVIHDAKDAPDDVVNDDDNGMDNGNNNDDSDEGKANDDDDHHHHYPKLPKYVEKDPYEHGYSHYYHPYPHHVYHEIKHTTTTEAPKEETRVSTSHYSYYYLGRKLWYIPLYFSVYFICYIVALILKSIARHKVSLVHTYGGKEGRSFSGDENPAEKMKMLEESQARYAM